MNFASTNKLNAFYKKTIIAIIDLFFLFFSNACIVYLTQGGHILATEYSHMLFSYLHFFIINGLFLIIGVCLGLYSSVWHFAGIDEMARNLISAVICSAMLFIVDRFLFTYILHYKGYLPFYAYFLMIVLEFVALCVPRIGFRAYKRFYHLHFGFVNTSKRVMIVGAGFMGDFFITNLITNNYKDGKPIIAVDDNPQKIGKRINGVKIKGSCSQIPQLAEKYNIDIIMICLPSASASRQKKIMDICLKTKCTIKISPSVDEFLESGGKAKRIRNIEITDLLARPEVKLEKKVCNYLTNQTVLVTGGGGSIGSEICSQVARYNPNCIVIFDIYENCAFELENKLKEQYSDNIDIEVRIGSIRDKARLDDIFSEFHPNVVFHAAAHKHVPLMEESPCETVKNNVFGTYNVALACCKYKVKKMVALSTDKAVNPTNVMGCTKRITEIIIQYMNKICDGTVYSAVRFGNVLGSHGSVIPIFKKQIENGGPVTVTHPDIERYFMTIPEAAQLVCQAGGLSKGGEIFVLDMGTPVKIMDLAKNMINLAGYTEDEIEIKVTGLRPGEKMYEELAMESEIKTRKKTALEKIYVTQPMEITSEFFNKMMDSLRTITDENVRQKLSDILPNYHSAIN